MVYRYASTLPGGTHLVAIPGTPNSTAPPVPAIAVVNVIGELIETERSYVLHLDVLQNYAMLLPEEPTIMALLANLDGLLGFQREFLRQCEEMNGKPWPEQDWGRLFLDNANAAVDAYEPYCADHASASDALLDCGLDLSALDHLLNSGGELPAFLIKPVSRICKYPLLLSALLKNTPPSLPTHTSLAAGIAAAERVADGAFSAYRRGQQARVARTLAVRVKDWKGHDVRAFGALCLHGAVTVLRPGAGAERVYQVFLFERVVVCCKLVEGEGPRILGPRRSRGSGREELTPLKLKGRIFLKNMTAVELSAAEDKPELTILWTSDGPAPEQFTLLFQSHEQMHQWAEELARLRAGLQSRRKTAAPYPKALL